MADQNDPRLRPIIDATTSLLVSENYDPHYANIATRIFMESLLFLARYDALMKFYDEQPNKTHFYPSFREAMPSLVVTNGDEVIPIYGVEPKPVDMILLCPNCGLQHIDAPESHIVTCPASEMYEEQGGDCTCNRWTNPPHRSHLCGYCNHIWRPADVPTNGVLDIQTRGKADSEPVLRQVKPLDRFRPQWQHNKRFTAYREIGRGEMQIDSPDSKKIISEGNRLVAYQGEDNRLWFRLETEFEDGRFTRI